jgi:hypothetical protein
MKRSSAVHFDVLNHVFVSDSVFRLVFVELKRSWTMVGPVSVPRPGGR